MAKGEAERSKLDRWLTYIFLVPKVLTCFQRVVFPFVHTVDLYLLFSFLRMPEQKCRKRGVSGQDGNAVMLQMPS